MAFGCHNFVFDNSSRYFTPNKLQWIACAGNLMNLKKNLISFLLFFFNYKVLPLRQNITLRHFDILTISVVYVEAVTQVLIFSFDNTSSPFANVLYGTNHA